MFFPALLIGFSLLVADPATKPAGESRVEKPTIISTAEWNSTPQPIADERKQTPKIITIHHAGVLWKPGDVLVTKVKNMQSWGQRERNWPDVPYHFFIGADGTIVEGRPMEYEPESNTEYPLNGTINIDVYGNFEEQRVSEAQLKSLAQLCAWLSDEHQLDLEQLRTHKDAAPGQTICPGKDLYQYVQGGQVRAWTDQVLAGEEPKIELLPPLPDGPTVMIGEPIEEKKENE